VNRRAERAAAMLPPPVTPFTRNMIGTPVARREDYRLLTGHGKFLDDLDIPGTLEAAFLRSDFAHAASLASTQAPRLTCPA